MRRTDSVSKRSLRSEEKTCPCVRWTLPIPKLYGRGSYTFLFATGRGGGSRRTLSHLPLSLSHLTKSG